MKQNPRVTILIVDDDPQLIELITLMLSPTGYNVISTRCAEECGRMAIIESPDLILLDVCLPGMDGNAVARLLSENDITRDIPIIMMSGFMDTESLLRALESGAVDFLEKPLTSDELVAKVRSLVRLKAYQNESRRLRVELLKEVAGKNGQLEKALDAFSRFVPREFLECLSKKSILEVSLGDQVQADMSILFADIRSFTALSEKMSPADNFSFLNSYLSRMNPFIWENGGYIDKYIGDAIMALFPNGPGGALQAAIAMLRYIPVYNMQRARFGYDPIRIGIGLNSGEVMLGIIGHERFMQGTVISDAVNLTARLEELTKAYGVALIISKYVLFGLENPNLFHYRFLDRVQLKGKSASVPVYEVFDADPPALFAQKSATRERFERAAYEYHAGRFQEALELFGSISLAGLPDRPVTIYMERCVSTIRANAQPV